MVEFLDKKKWEKAKKLADEVYKTHSAYKSGYIVKKYKELGGKFAGDKKKIQKKGLKRWFDEEWVNQRGEVGYRKKGDVYRPKKRITKDTPVTWEELTKKEIEKASKIKAKGQRVKRFKKVN